MLKTKRVIIDEGKYDEIKLRNIIEGTIFRTDGFGIFKDKEKLSLLRKLAKKRGLIVLTDSDGAGFVIRNYLISSIPKDEILNVYIPDIYGKEKRKKKVSKEGKLGVEGIPDKVLIEAFKKAGITESGIEENKEKKIENYDLFVDGLSGGKNSSEKRKKLQKKLDLPERMTKNQLLEVLNILFTFSEYKEFVNDL